MILKLFLIIGLVIAGVAVGLSVLYLVSNRMAINSAKRSGWKGW